MQRFYDTIEVWAASPYSLVGPYHRAHGGAQGNKMGATYFTKVSEKRTKFLSYVVRHSLRLEDMRLSNLPPGA